MAEIGADKVLVAMADVTDRAEVDAMVKATLDRFGRLDVLVNNATVRGEKPFEEPISKIARNHILKGLRVFSRTVPDVRLV